MTNTRDPLLLGVISGVVLVGLLSVWAFQSISLSGRTYQDLLWFATSPPSPPTLPSNVEKYSQVPKQGTFTAKSIPKGLLNDHNTQAGTWGVIRVLQGTLEYTILEPKQMVLELSAPATGVVVPQTTHHVKALTEDVEFIVEFYRVRGTGPVDEKREGL